MYEQSKRQILITGASGYVGDELCKAFSDKGSEINALFRYTRPQTRPNITPVCCNLFQEQALMRTMQGMDTVVHLAWQGGFANIIIGEETDEDAFANLKMTKTLIKVCEEMGIERFVFLSAIGASPNAESDFLREKYRCEWELLNSKIPEKVIIRSGIVYDGGINTDRFIQTITSLMAYPLFYPLPEAEKYLSVVHLKDIAAVCLGAVDVELNSTSSIIEVCEPQQYTLEDICKRAVAKYVPGKRLAIKGFASKLFLNLVEKKRKQTENQYSLKDVLNFGQQIDSENLNNNPLGKLIPENMETLNNVLLK